METIKSTLLNYQTISISVALFIIIGCTSTKRDAANQIEKVNCEFIRTTQDSLNIYYCKEYYDNGFLYREGKYVEDTAIDWHTFYNEDGSLYMKVHYEWLNGHTNSNPQQIIKFDTNGDTIKSQSNYYRIFCNDTIALGDTFYAQIDVSISDWDSVLIETYFNIPNDTIFLRLMNNLTTTIDYDYVPQDTGLFSMSGQMIIYNGDSVAKRNDTLNKGLIYMLMNFHKEYYVKEKKQQVTIANTK